MSQSSETPQTVFQILFAIITGHLTTLLIVSVPILVYVWAKHVNSYWSRTQVPFIPGNLFIGNLLQCLRYKIGAAELFQQFYNNPYTADKPIVGIHLLLKPALLIRDTDLIRRILVTDFNSFNNRHTGTDPHTDPIGSNNLFFAKNRWWKTIRSRLTPLFSTGKIRQTFVLVNEIGNDLNRELLSASDAGHFEIEIKDMCARYTTDIIASCAFGLNANSLKNPNSEFRENGRNLFKYTIYRAIEFSSIFFFPELCPIFRFKLFANETNDFLRSAISSAIAQREQSGIIRNDLIDTLITLKREDADKQKTESDELIFDGDTLVSQAGSFFLAGFETSSSAIAFSLFELAWHPELQDRLREEIRSVLFGDDKIAKEITYDKLMEMEYLDMVVSETLRKYPVLPFLDRQCTSESSYDLNPIFDFKIPKGMPVLIPIYAIHHDPTYYPNPSDYDPERFSSQSNSNITPYTYLPFGTGPHNCIGNRFGLMVTKVGLINFIKNHIVKPSPNTPKTITFEPKSMVIQVKGGVFLDVIRKPLCD